MPKKERKKHEMMNVYLKNYYSGIDEKVLHKVKQKKTIF